MNDNEFYKIGLSAVQKSRLSNYPSYYTNESYHKNIDFFLTHEDYNMLLVMCNKSNITQANIISQCANYEIDNYKDISNKYHINKVIIEIGKYNSYIKESMPIPEKPLHECTKVLSILIPLDTELVSLLMQLCITINITRHELLSYWIHSNTHKNNAKRNMRYSGYLNTVVKFFVENDNKIINYNKQKETTEDMIADDCIVELLKNMYGDYKYYTKTNKYKRRSTRKTKNRS